MKRFNELTNPERSRDFRQMNGEYQTARRAIQSGKKLTGNKNRLERTKLINLKYLPFIATFSEKKVSYSIHSVTDIDVKEVGPLKCSRETCVLQWTWSP